jgi:hypothetical protein
MRNIVVNNIKDSKPSIREGGIITLVEYPLLLIEIFFSIKALSINKLAELIKNEPSIKVKEKDKCKLICNSNTLSLLKTKEIGIKV